MEDAIALLREALADIPDQQGTHTVTRKQLSQAVDVLATSLLSRPVDAAGWTTRFAQLTVSSHTVADMAQALAQERADGADSELRIWADAVKSCVESHLRDMELSLPWVRLSRKDLAAMFDHPDGPVPEWATIAPFFHPVPTLATAPERFTAALRALDRLREDSLSNPSQNRPSLTRIALLADAIRQSAADAAALIRRLTIITQTAEQMARAMDFTFLFDPTQAVVHRLPRDREQLGTQLLRLACVGSPAGKLYGYRRGDVPSSHWFHLGRAPTPGGKWCGPDFMVRLHFRIPHAGLGDAFSARQLAEPDV